MSRLKCCNKISCGMGVLTRPDGRDAHPTRVKLMDILAVSRYYALSPLPAGSEGIKGWGAMAVGIITNYADMI